MSTVTKKELIDRIAKSTQAKRVSVKRIIQVFLDEMTAELSKGNRLEFRDFGVFETGKVQDGPIDERPAGFRRPRIGGGEINIEMQDANRREQRLGKVVQGE
jgi:hypothetical protein